MAPTRSTYGEAPTRVVLRPLVVIAGPSLTTWRAEATAARRHGAVVKRALAGSASVRSVLELSRVSGIRPGTMFDWFSGRREPRGS